MNYGSRPEIIPLRPAGEDKRSARARRHQEGQSRGRKRQDGGRGCNTRCITVCNAWCNVGGERRWILNGTFGLANTCGYIDLARRAAASLLVIPTGDTTTPPPSFARTAGCTVKYWLVNSPVGRARSWRTEKGRRARSGGGAEGKRKFHMCRKFE